LSYTSPKYSGWYPNEKIIIIKKKEKKMTSVKRKTK